MSPGPTPRDPTAGRVPFVVQAHDAPPLHYDVMVQQGEALRTFACPTPPEAIRVPTPVEAKADHRLAYLTLEGEVSGGRGTTRIWDRGACVVHRWDATGADLTFHGERLRGRYRLSCGSGPPMLEPVDETRAAPTPRGERRHRAAAAPRRRSGSRVARLLLLAIVPVLAAIAGLNLLRIHYRARYNEQAYLSILRQAYERERSGDLRPETAFEVVRQPWIGQRVEVIGRVGSIGAGRAPGQVELWVDVPGPIEDANVSREDVRCALPEAAIEEGGAAPPPGTGHRHRFQRHDLVVVEGRIASLEMSSTAWLVAALDDATIRPPSAIEAWLFEPLARTLASRADLTGLTDVMPRRDKPRPK